MKLHKFLGILHRNFSTWKMYLCCWSNYICKRKEDADSLERR